MPNWKAVYYLEKKCEMVWAHWQTEALQIVDFQLQSVSHGHVWTVTYGRWFVEDGFFVAHEKFDLVIDSRLHISQTL